MAFYVFCTFSGLTGSDKQFKGEGPLWSPVDFDEMQMNTVLVWLWVCFGIGEHWDTKKTSRVTCCPERHGPRAIPQHA